MSGRAGGRAGGRASPERIALWLLVVALPAVAVLLLRRATPPAAVAYAAVAVTLAPWLLARAAVAAPRGGGMEALRRLAAALEARHGYTLGHGERVAALAVMIGEHMGFPTARLHALKQGALLHDLGKITVPESILNKPGRLAAADLEAVRRHPSDGEMMLASAFTGPVERAVIRHHHERYDGGGYPDGLAGVDIPLEARIVGVADAFDALRSERAHRPAWGRVEALRHVWKQSGRQFDPQVVQAFLAVVDRWEAECAADLGTRDAGRRAA